MTFARSIADVPDPRDPMEVVHLLDQVAIYAHDQAVDDLMPGQTLQLGHRPTMTIRDSSELPPDLCSDLANDPVLWIAP